MLIEFVVKSTKLWDSWVVESELLRILPVEIFDFLIVFKIFEFSEEKKLVLSSHLSWKTFWLPFVNTYGNWIFDFFAVNQKDNCMPSDTDDKLAQCLPPSWVTIRRTEGYPTRIIKLKLNTMISDDHPLWHLPGRTPTRIWCWTSSRIHASETDVKKASVGGLRSFFARWVICIILIFYKPNDINWSVEL